MPTPTLPAFSISHLMLLPMKFRLISPNLSYIEIASSDKNSNYKTHLTFKKCSGTGSNPPLLKGLQRKIL